MSRLSFAALLFALTVAQAAAAVPAPTALVIVACRVDDLTGQPGRQDPRLAARDWRDLELHVNKNQELECKRERIDLDDGVALNYGPGAAAPLNPDFGDWSQCARVGVMQAGDWNRKHPGWGVVAVGCPTPIVNGNGAVVGWKLPDCPTYLPGTTSRMRCRFDASVI